MKNNSKTTTQINICEKNNSVQMDEHCHFETPQTTSKHVNINTEPAGLVTPGMFPVRCFTCGKLIGHLSEKYEQLIESKSFDDALDELNIVRFCCRRMFISHNFDLERTIGQYQKGVIVLQKDHTQQNMVKLT